jgi:choice-of-anchor A domain-containing protein
MAPLINVNYPTNGLVTNQPITLDFNVTDDHQFTIQAQLNGQDISAGFVVSQDGIHNLEFIATDEVGNSSSKSIQFRLDQQAPLIQILNVSNEQQYLESLIDIQGITEVNSQVHLTIGALELQTQANNLGEFNFDQVELQLGANDLIFNATDIASNSAQSVSLRVYYSLAESCEIFGFSTASPYNIWVQGDYMAQSTSVSGRLASGGDLLIDYYSIGQSLNSETAGDVLVVGGDINFNHGQVYFGNILAAGSTEAIGQDVINNMAFGAQILGNANLPIDFNQTQKDLYLFSNALNDEANTGSILRVDQELKLIGNCNSNSGMHVFNLAAQDLSGVNSITYECLAAQTYAIINISGDQVEFINLDSSSFSSIRQHVLYNISQANQVLLYNSQIHGSIMAPYATIRSENSLVSDLIFTNGFDSNNNKIFGQVIANSWESNAEIHSSDFACGNLQLNSAPIARDITFDGFINTPIVIGLVVLDEQIESLQYQLISSPDFGQISGSWPNISYTPNLNYSGTDQFIYTVTDSQGQMGQATVTIIISDDIIFKDNFEEVFQMIGSLLPLQLFYITSYFLSDEFELINKANFLWRRS